MLDDDYDAMYGSTWLRADDVKKGEKRRVTIRKVEIKQFDNEPRPKFVLHFDPPHKPFSLNKTNAGVISEALGKDRARWIGVEIILYRTKTSGKDGKMVDCVRIEMPDGTGFADLQSDTPWQE